jgi:hypothetical protein
VASHIPGKPEIFEIARVLVSFGHRVNGCCREDSTLSKFTRWCEEHWSGECRHQPLRAEPLLLMR